MPNIKSAKKSVKANSKKSETNTVYTTRAKTSIKKIENAIKDNNKETANTELKNAYSNIDKAASKGLIKQNAANRLKKRLNKKVKEIK